MRSGPSCEASVGTEIRRGVFDARSLGQGSRIHVSRGEIKPRAARSTFQGSFTMPSPRQRRFTLFDALALVAASAGGLAVIRSNGGFTDWSDLDAEKTLVPRTIEIACTYLNDSCPLLFSWSYACLVLRMRQPRPNVRRIARQPGFAAATMTVLVSIVKTLEHVAVQCGFYLRKAAIEPLYDLVTNLWLSTELVSLAIACTWMFMALGRRCLPERSWIDRFGRVLGGTWILFYVLRVLHNTTG